MQDGECKALKDFEFRPRTCKDGRPAPVNCDAHRLIRHAAGIRT
jgi:hypothetical protein